MNYNLICDAGHETVGYSSSIAAFEKARDEGFLECAKCITSHGASAPVRQALSAPSVITQSKTKTIDKRDTTPHYEEVGDRFFDVALNMAAGEEDLRPLKGHASEKQVEILGHLGFDVRRALPTPKFDS